MSSARLNKLVTSALLNNDKNAAIDAYNEWQIGQCYYPIKQRIYDAHTQTSREVLLPCGRCYHCYESKINEWCTRMYAHAEDFKHVYFVTLSYRSFANCTNAVNRLMLDKLNEAIWHFDSLNQNKHLSYSPCLLVKSHYQNFLKRLRKNTGLSDITYVLSGEYGSKYGRPHFHMVLFSNGVLTKDDIIRSWSVCLWRNIDGSFCYRKNQRKNGTAFNFPIGRVDFHDLVSNGSFNTTAKIKIDGRYLNASNCFAYVCKYVCKRDKGNLSRVNLAYSKLFIKQSFVKVFDHELQFYKVHDYLNSVGYKFDILDDKVNQLKKFQYEKTMFQPSPRIYMHGVSQFKKRILFTKKVDFEFYPSVKFEFNNRFLPFVEFSRGCPIGSIYAKRHLSEFKDDVFKRPLLQTCGFVVPSYFRRKASESLYPLRQKRNSLFSSSNVLTPLQNLLGRFEDAYKNNIRLREYLSFKVDNQNINDSLQNSLKFFVDVSSGERILLYNEHAQYYKYSRHSRNYEFTHSIPLKEWIYSCINLIRDELKRHDSLLSISERNKRYRDYALGLISENITPYTKLRDKFVSKQDEYLFHKSNIYESIHLSAE